MNIPTKHWGEIENPSEVAFIPDVSADIERSMNKFCLAEFDTEFDDISLSTENIILPSMDPLMLYAISLHKHANDMTEMISVAKLAVESDFIPPAAPPIPEIPEIQRKHNRNGLNFIPKEFTSFSLGESTEIPELSEAVTKQILAKCVATMFAHIGYETTHQSVLDLLTDVLEEFLKKISRHVKIAHEDEQKGQLGFPHVAERVLTELGMGGVKGLHDYYQTRVVKYISILHSRCKELNNLYEEFLVPKSSPLVDATNKVVRVTLEEDDEVVEVDNPQVHFPTIDGEVGFSSLEPGFQLLNSLEAVTNLQTLGESEEDISVTASPGVVSIPETEMSSTLSNYNKKKRLK